MGAITKYGDFEFNSGMEDGSKTAKWLAFHPGEALGFRSPKHLAVLGSRCGEIFSEQLIALQKEKYRQHLKSKLKILEKCHR